MRVWVLFTTPRAGSGSGAVVIPLLTACLACTSLGSPAPSGGPRRVTGCRFEPVHYEEVYRCDPNPATAARLLCGYRKERVSDRWWLEYENGEPRDVDRKACEVEGELKRWECHTAEGYVFLDEEPPECE